MRHRCDRRQRLAAKPERPDGREVVRPPDLAGGMTLDRQPRIAGLHPFPIVFDANLLLASELDVDRQPPGPGVQGVLDQFLDDRGRTLDDLAGGDLVG